MIEKSECEDFRRQLKPIADNLIALVRDGDANLPNPEMRPEVIANVMLAYRHLEDASMRLGKAIQAIDGGISVYDKTQVPDVVMGPRHG